MSCRSVDTLNWDHRTCIVLIFQYRKYKSQSQSQGPVQSNADEFKDFFLEIDELLNAAAKLYVHYY